jgi:Acyl-CoA carboxylase epsilon subunit
MLDSVAEEPLLRVVRGVPTPEELAALVGVVAWQASLTRDTGPASPPPVARWWASGLPRAGHRPGPGAWRAAALPS